MSDYIDKKNIQTLLARLEALVNEVDELKGGLVTNSNALISVGDKLTAVHNMVHLALVKTKGHGSTEPDNGD